MEKSKKHYVLVHGACHGAWCWYKVKPILEKSGHRVTAIDLAASGIHPNTMEDLNTLTDYSRPLIEFMTSVPDDETVVIVGHSFGGMTLAVVMELFPSKIKVAVFVAAFMPDSLHHPAFIFDQFVARMPSVEDYWLDTKFKSAGDPTNSLTTMFFGRKFLWRLYECSPLEDFELAKMLVRPSSLFLHDLLKARKFSNEKYETVARVYIMCEADRAIPKEFQSWMVENGGVDEVKELLNADHMPMLSMPQKLCDYLLEIAHKY